MIDVDAEASKIAQGLLATGILPGRAKMDATHLAVATVAKMDFLVTWNCTHLANGEVMRQVIKRWKALGYDIPQVITPEQLPGVVR